MRTERVLPALTQALHAHSDTEGLIHHSDRGSQYLSIRYSARLAEAGIHASVGSHGDSCDNALDETIHGLYKAKVIARRKVWGDRAEVELATLEWEDWYNHRRLLSSTAHVPPAECEDAYHRRREGLTDVG